MTFAGLGVYVGVLREFLKKKYNGAIQVLRNADGVVV